MLDGVLDGFLPPMACHVVLKTLENWELDQIVEPALRVADAEPLLNLVCRDGRGK